MTIYATINFESIESLFKYFLSYYNSSPLLFILIIFIIFISLVLLTKVIELYLRDPSDKLVSIIENSNKVGILMHENPDPDSMASALGIKFLAMREGNDVEIFYSGDISHHENRAFRAVLDVTFTKIDNKDDLSCETIILVDHHEPRGFEGSTSVVPDVIIDHHSRTVGFNDDNIEFSYIDSSYGACSTIVYEFLKEQNIVIDDEQEQDSLDETTSTALYYGIISDTDNLIRSVSRNDYYASMNLYDGINKDSLYRISNPKIDEDSLETKANAILNRDVRGPFAVSYVKNIMNSDSIPQSADALVKLEGLSSVVVIGECEDNIRLSGRAYDDRVHMGDVISHVLQDVDGASGGGHSKMGGGMIPKEKFDSSELTKDDLIENIFTILNGNTEV